MFSYQRRLFTTTQMRYWVSAANIARVSMQRAEGVPAGGCSSVIVVDSRLIAYRVSTRVDWCAACIRFYIRISKSCVHLSQLLLSSQREGISPFELFHGPMRMLGACTTNRWDVVKWACKLRIRVHRKLVSCNLGSRARPTSTNLCD